MQWFLMVLYVIVCLFLVGVVLMQRGKDSSGDLFGSGAGSVLSGQGTTSFLVRLTGTLSLLFFLLSFFLGVVINQSSDRLRLDEVIKAKEEILIESLDSLQKASSKSEK
ncbi:MAG: preprotein translocase subunit SecG [Pseudomonadota bacterium]|nr:preprotein translocase subunit SecG [Pseudomonadota bacterium]